MNNDLKIDVSLENIDEVIKKLETVKKLLQEMKDITINIEVSNNLSELARKVQPK